MKDFAVFFFVPINLFLFSFVFSCSVLYFLFRPVSQVSVQPSLSLNFILCTSQHISKVIFSEKLLIAVRTIQKVIKIHKQNGFLAFVVTSRNIILEIQEIRSTFYYTV